MPAAETSAGATPATALAEPAKPAFDPAELAYYSGGELLTNATVDDEPTNDGLPELWTPENAAGEEEGDTKPAPEPKPEETAPEPKPEEVDTDSKPDTEKVAEPLETAEARERKAWPESAQKRVDRLTAEKNDLYRERDELKARLETERTEKEQLASAPRAPAPAHNPLANVTSEKALEAHTALAELAEEWADENRDGGELPAELHAALKGIKPSEITETWYMTSEEAKILLRNARKMRRTYIPERTRFLTQQKAVEAGLRADNPALFDTGTVEGQLFTKLQQEVPQVMSHPAWQELLAYAVTGYISIKGKKPAGKADGHPPAPVPPAAAASRGAARPQIGKPERRTPLKASMSTAELAEAM